MAVYMKSENVQSEFDSKARSSSSSPKEQTVVIKIFPGSEGIKQFSERPSWDMMK